MSAFSLTERQQLAMAVMASPRIEHMLLFGGSRSGKTFLAIRAIVLRAMRAPGSRHAVLRFRFNSCKASIVHDTFPKVMKTCFPQVEYDIDKTSWFAILPNGSEIWFGGLDDKERTEKILGQEFVTIYLVEISQISWQARGLVVTRLAQAVYEQTADGGQRLMRLRMFYDENPPDKAHWSYRFFIQKVDPETREPLPAHQADAIGAFQLNPKDNLANLPPTYLDTLKSLSSRLQRRFLEGLFKDTNPDALFPETALDKWRTLEELPDMLRVVVAIDPSGADDEDNAENDEIGIVAAGVGTDGVGYLLEDSTLKGGPGLWGKAAVALYDRRAGDLIVGEVNYGGAMVGFVIKTARPGVSFKKITASRGKVLRAEPLSALVEDGRIRLAGTFHKLEDELAGFTTRGYTGDKSPNRADAFVIAFAELFPGIVKPRQVDKAKVHRQGHPDDEEYAELRVHSHAHAAHADSWMNR